jgi:hemoglobin/transferrin/lactoferrin receptor protein
MKTTLLSATAAAALALAAGAPQSARAESPSSSHQVGDVIVTATRTPTRLADAAAPISVVTPTDFDQGLALDYKEVLERLPNVDFFGGPRPSGEMPSIRGATGRQLLILVDGVRQSAAPTLSSPLYMESGFLAQAEVLRGASSVLYGPGAIGGVLSFRTQAPEDLLSPGSDFGADVRTDYHDAAEDVRGMARVFGRSGDFSALAGVSYRQWGEISQGGGDKLEPSDGEALSLFLRGAWQATDRLQLALSHQYYDMEDFRPNNPQADNSFPYMQTNRVRQNQTVLGLAGTDKSGQQDLHGVLYRTRLETGADENAAVTPVLTANESVLETIGASLSRDLLFHTGSFSHRLTVGGDAFRDKLTSRSNGQPDGVAPDGEQSAAGAFLHDEIMVTSWLGLAPALRWDRFKTSVATGVAPDRSAEAVSPQVTVTVRPAPALLVYGSYGEAFRAPSVNEMFQSLTGNAFFANFAPNPALEPESATETAIGASWTHDMAPGRLSLRLDGFRQEVEDLIVARVIGTYRHPVLGIRPVQQYQNVNRAEREGFEASAAFAGARYGVSLAYGQVRSRDRDTRENLFSPPDKWTFNVDYDLTPQVSLSWRALWVEAQNYDATVVRRRPGYDVHDAFIAWSPQGRPWRLTVGVSNLFDERYAAYKQSTIYPTTYEQGRSLRLSLGARF